MQIPPKVNFKNTFEVDVFKGLTSSPKYLLSKYIYNEKGDKLFQQIMRMPEYYLTNCEYEIIKKHSPSIARLFNTPEGFDLIELGAGDGKKTKILLRYLVQNNYNFSYAPIDISGHALEQLEISLKEELPELTVKTQQGTYFQILNHLVDHTHRKKVILFLGSNIGNLLHQDAIEFLKNIGLAMTEDDMLFMGFDQKKDPQKILNAYNDSSKITEAFNKNLLLRINAELGADFDPDSFLHWPTYDPETGTTKNFLVSKTPQSVNIPHLDLEVKFDAWESIHTEISQKYDENIIKWLASEADLKIESSFSDDKNWYKNYIFKKNTLPKKAKEATKNHSYESYLERHRSRGK